MQRYRLTEEQRSQLLEDIKEIGSRLLAINFDDPKADDAMIRHHAYLRGKWDMLQTVVQDNFPETDYQEGEQQ
jgi:hypothetical protein